MSYGLNHRLCDDRYRINRRELRKGLGLDEHLDRDFEMTFPQAIVKVDGGTITLDVMVKRMPDSVRSKTKSSAHRIFVKCGCGKEIPAGRLHQHRSACTHPLPEIR